MIRRKNGLFVTTIAVIALTMGFGPATGVAGATSPGPTTSARPAPAATAGKGAIATSPQAASAPKGYVIVNSGALDDPAGQWTFGRTYCPAGTVVWGGGVTASGGLEQTLNSSFPSTSGPPAWEVYINNAESSDESFTVYAVCAKKPKKYVIEEGPAASPAGDQTPVSATCPAQTVVLGGGTYVNALGPLFGINSSFPAGNQWISDINNSSGVTVTVATDAICGKRPKHYAVVSGGTSDNPPGANSPDSASCPAKTSILSAGVISSASETSVNVTELNADRNAVAFMANASASDHTMNVYAVCAK